MACLLRPGDAFVSDAKGAPNAQPLVFIRNKNGQAVKVVSARMSGQALKVDKVSIKLPPLAHGVNVLRLIVEDIAVGDVAELVELCDTGEDHVLSEKSVGAAPGGSEPVLGFIIDAQ